MKRKIIENAMSNCQLQITQWPVQLHLVVPEADYFKNKELVIMSTCAPLFLSDIQNQYLTNKSVVLACPKLDYSAPYFDKLADIFREGEVLKIIAVIMDVPCCNELSIIVKEASSKSANLKLSLEEHKIGINGTIIKKSIIFEN
jgi:hypothetical protein